MVQNVTPSERLIYSRKILMYIWGQAVLGHKRRWMDCFFDVAWFASFSCLLCYSIHMVLVKYTERIVSGFKLLFFFVCNSSKMPTRITITNYTTALLLLHWKWNFLFHLVIGELWNSSQKIFRALLWCSFSNSNRTPFLLSSLLLV